MPAASAATAAELRSPASQASAGTNASVYVATCANSARRRTGSRPSPPRLCVACHSVWSRKSPTAWLTTSTANTSTQGTSVPGARDVGPAGLDDARARVLGRADRGSRRRRRLGWRRRHGEVLHFDRAPEDARERPVAAVLGQPAG